MRSTSSCWVKNMRVLFSTNIPSPYRVSFFNELGKHCDLTVCFERKRASDRDLKWTGSKVKNYLEIYLNLIHVGTDQSRGNALAKFIARNKFDVIVLTNYASPATIKAILYCKRHKVKYCIESDGGFYKKDKLLKAIIKKYLLCSAIAHLTTCDEHIKYLKSIGVETERIYKYPFTSVDNIYIDNAQNLLKVDKQSRKEQLGISEEKVVISVGQFIPRKGFDVLLESCKNLSDKIGVYVIGGEPTDEYIEVTRKLNLKNVHFVGFKTKDELSEYYAAADVYVMPTREDIWGLVINEAMAFGLPVVSTNACIAALEMVRNGENGYIVPTDNPDQLSEAIKGVLNSDKISDLSTSSLNAAKQYTIEKMVERHLEILKELYKGVCSGGTTNIRINSNDESP